MATRRSTRVSSSSSSKRGAEHVTDEMNEADEEEYIPTTAPVSKRQRKKPRTEAADSEEAVPQAPTRGRGKGRGGSRGGRRGGGRAEPAVAVVAEVEAGGEDEKKQSMSEQFAESWIPGSDIKSRAAVLCRILGELYRLRWGENDRFKMIHWRKIALFLDDYSRPLISEEDVAALITYRGVGPRTVETLKEVLATGYIDWMDDLLVEVEAKLETYGARPDRVQLFAQIRERAERMGASNLDARAAGRSRILQLRANVVQEEKTIARVKEMVSKGVVLTGAQRRKLVEAQQAAGGSTDDSEEKKVIGEEKVATRLVSREKKMRKALFAAVKADECAICLDEYADEDEMVVFDCEHCFHLRCVRVWLATRLENHVQPSCPLCRRPIKV